MPTIPRLLYRFDHQVIMTIRSKPDVRAYRFKAAHTIDLAYTAPVAMFDARRGAPFRSPAIRRRRLGFTDQTQRGLTRIHYDPQDYQGGIVPPDAHISFVRIAEVANDGTVRPDGPILIVPSPRFLNTPRPALTVAGTAPAVAALPTLLPPPTSMHFVFPRYTDNVKIANLGGVSLFVGTDPGQPEFEIPTGETYTFYDTTLGEVLIRGGGAPVTFTLIASLVNGIYE